MQTRQKPIWLQSVLKSRIRGHLPILAWWFAAALPALCGASSTRAAFDAAPFALSLPEGNGLMWEDPRELHKVVIHFGGAAPAPENLRLEYWGSRWPNQHLPKDRQPGGADVGWMELGNWYRGDWREADCETKAIRSEVIFTFRPVNEKEFPGIKDYPATFRYTLKIRVASDNALPKVERIEAFTDSVLSHALVRLEWKEPPRDRLKFEAFNGAVVTTKKLSRHSVVLELETVSNPDPNTFDRTLITVHGGKKVFTFAVDDLSQGALFVPHLGVAVLPENDSRDYAAIAAGQKSNGARTLYDRITDLPERTWRAAWAGLPRKKSDIYFPLGLDGGRQRFRLDPDGGVRFRSNDGFLQARPGADTPRLALEPPDVQFQFSLPTRPIFRTIEDASIPICHTSWETNGIRISQTAFVTKLEGARAEEPVPPADALAVLVAEFVFTNVSQSTQTASLPLRYRVGDTPKPLRVGEHGSLWLGEYLRGQVFAEQQAIAENEKLVWTWKLAPGESQSITFKLPYLVLTEQSEYQALANLDFQKEREAVAGYWRRRLDQSAHLSTPEPMLNEFYRAHAGHLLINCEREPNSTRRFARVGSFHYGAFANESCMMVVDLDRRGYHEEAQECLDAWLHYQGTVGLPGDFSSKNGILYGAGGYEHGGYNQHHGWILWCLVEHYRFTRDENWLRHAAAGVVSGADWIIRETRRTADRHELERGLLPAGSLEDIGDWWPWLSTSCYTWRGLDSAAWALEQIKHPEARRIRKEADTYHVHLLANFRQASQRSPVVRLRDGISVPQIPSQVHRRGRSFGWICQTLEGSMHLLITRALDARSQEAERIIKDYEDNLYLSNQYGYTVDDFERRWFDRGGMSMQACLLFDVEPYLYRDDIKHALRALFNAESVSYFPDVRMNTEHAAPYFDDWRGDHYKSSDEANACGWLRQLFVREEGDTMLLGQAVPREWLRPGQKCGLERAATYFGPASVVYTAGENEITAQVEGPRRNPPKEIRLRFRQSRERRLSSVTVNGKNWRKTAGDWVLLPGDIGSALVVAHFASN
jgi:hypothetical protein